MDGNAGNNLAIGDCTSILFSDNYFLRSIVSTSPSVGESDVINMGDGNDMAIGGSDKDTIYGYNGTNILVGDTAMVLYYGSKLPTGTSPVAEKFWSVRGEGGIVKGGWVTELSR